MLDLIINFYPLLLVSAIVNLTFIVGQRKKFFLVQCTCLDGYKMMICLYACGFILSCSITTTMAYLFYECGYVYYYGDLKNNTDLFKHKLNLLVTFGTTFSSTIYLVLINYGRQKAIDIIDRYMNIKSIAEQKKIESINNKDITN